MGLYIEPPVATGKADWLVKNAGAEIVDDQMNPSMPGWGKVLVCAVSNPMFDAAAVAYNERERDRFNSYRNGDMRPRVWLTMSLENALALGSRDDFKRYKVI
jgi:hypothetical protein